MRITKIGDNIITPLGETTAAVYSAVMAGESRLEQHEGTFGLRDPFCGSLLDRARIDGLYASEVGDPEDYTFFERLCILSATRALAEAGIDAAADDVLFILSTTKGNVDLLADDPDDPRCYLAASAGKIACHFGNRNTPVVVSNACISGVCAQIAGVRELLGGHCRHAVIVGGDVLSRFIVSGFQSFKALSPEPCRPYDKQRTGLNLGEAAGTLILSSDTDKAGTWEYAACSNHNDANHISGPSRTGEGSYRVLRDILREVKADELAFVNAHGTATAYNDEMESIALHRAGLDSIPVNGLKGYFGHTLGAAGIIETILSMQAADHDMVYGTRGYKAQGTTYALNISDKPRSADRKAFIKILSGFGGSNAGIAYRKGGKA